MPRHFKVTVNGREYEVSVLELAPGETAPAPVVTAPVVAATGFTAAAAPHPAPGAASTAPPATGDVLAGMGGIVVEVNVSVGQTVNPGDRLLVLEAMKMKSPVIATLPGRVTRVLVIPRQAVEGGQVLVTIA